MRNLFDKVKKTRWGFYQLIDIPDEKELNEYYEKKYYQNSLAQNQRSYSERERTFFSNRAGRKLEVVRAHTYPKPASFVDIGCGEGWALEAFRSAGFQVYGVDYSSYGVRQFHPHLVSFFKQGNVLEQLRRMDADRYSVALMDNVLEHLREPVDVLKDTHKVLKKDGVLIVEVPNDFSKLQVALCEQGKIDRPFWVASPDHINYFSLESLKLLVEEQSFELVDAICDFPIDFFLANDQSNYVRRENVGRASHEARLLIENLMDEISTQQAVAMYRELAKLEMGRNIVAFFKKK